MRKLQALFIGVGSIARRHIVNLANICWERGIELKIDAIRSGHGQPLTDNISSLVRHVYYCNEEVPDGYDVAFVTNPTKCHLQALIDFQIKAKHFFIEKPFIDRSQLAEWENRRPSIHGIAYVACPLRYTRVIQYLKQHTKPDKVHAVRVISSSYLPDWRPGQDYRKTYSAHRDLGGGVSIDLIHEWDYICYLFGVPDRVQSFITKVSQLEIDSDDIAVYLGRYPDKIIEVHLDYFGRKTLRNIEIYTEDDTIIGDLVKGKVVYLCEGRTIDLQEDRDTYQLRELSCFLDLIEGKKIEYNSIDNAVHTLKLTMGD